MDWILFIVVLVISWITAFALHEIGHYLTAIKLGGKANIKLWFYKNIIPSLITYHSGVKKADLWLVKLFGGMTTALVFIPIGLIMLLIINPALGHAILLPGLVNFFYSFYETLLLGKVKLDTYMVGHYILYAIVIISYFIIFRGWF